MQSNSCRILSTMATTSTSGSSSSTRRYPQNNRQNEVITEKFIILQLMQTLLFTFRILFLTYDIVHAVIHKVILYERIGKMLGGNALESESIYTASLALISLFLIVLIILTFIYNYFLVHENLAGIFLMGFYLVSLLIYNIWNFGRYSIMESAVVCSCSVGEIIALLYLIKLLKHKKLVRAIAKAEERRLSKSAFETVRHQSKKLDPNSTSPSGQRQMPHQRKYDARISPAPEITITGDDENPVETQNDVNYSPSLEDNSNASDDERDEADKRKSSEESIKKPKEHRKHHRKHHRKRVNEQEDSEISSLSIDLPIKETRIHYKTNNSEENIGDSCVKINSPGSNYHSSDRINYSQEQNFDNDYLQTMRNHPSDSFQYSTGQPFDIQTSTQYEQILHHQQQQQQQQQLSSIGHSVQPSGISPSSVASSLPPPPTHIYEHSISQLPHYYPIPVSGQPL